MLVFNAVGAHAPVKNQMLASTVLGRPGGISGEPVPDPIPNSAVKLPRANGTKSQDLEEQVAARPAKDGSNLFNDEWCIHMVHERPPAMAAVLFVELPSANSETA